MSTQDTEQAQRRGVEQKADAAAEGLATPPTRLDSSVSSDSPDPQSTAPEASAVPGKKISTKRKQPRRRNNVRKLRTERMMSKAELARRAGLSTLTVDRVEKGMPCRMDTKRKILEALGLTPSDRVSVFGEED